MFEHTYAAQDKHKFCGDKHMFCRDKHMSVFVAKTKEDIAMCSCIRGPHRTSTRFVAANTCFVVTST